MLKAAVVTLGCKVNQYEGELIQGIFVKNGYMLVDFNEAADVYVINTCSVTQLSEKKSRQLIRRARRNNSSSIIAVTGCFAQIAPEEIIKTAAVDVIVGTQQRSRIVELVEQVMQERRQINIVSDVSQAVEFEEMPLLAMPGRTRAFLKIQDGCENYCSYCIIPYTRGPLKSRQINSIISEAKRLIAGGFKEIVLTGIHLGAYGRELAGVNLADAVRAVLELEGLCRIRLGSLETIELSEDVIDIMRNDSRMCPHLHLPLQSGDNTILKRMNRNYTIEEYRKIIGKLQETIADIAISTDIITGFPGEEIDKFQNTLNVIKNMKFSRIHVFPFSARSGTLAAKYSDKVKDSEKKRRTELLLALAEHEIEDLKKVFIGRRQEVLFESAENGIISGLTGNYNKVYAAGQQDLVGKIYKVQIEKIFRDGLWGKIIK